MCAPVIYLLDESEVVADQHHPSFKLVDGFSKCVDGLNVQVIGRFIEEEHVWVLPGQPGETHSTLLTI